MRIFKALAFLVLITVLTGAVLLCWLIATHSFSAREKPHEIEAFIAKNLRSLAIPAGIKALKNPLGMSQLETAQARDHFADHCAVCHNNNGDGKTMINDGLYPPAPDLREAGTQQLTDGEIFYIIKNGIRFTGMPGWGGEDEDNWKLVGLIRHLPKLSQKELALMKEVNGMDVPSGLATAH